MSVFKRRKKLARVLTRVYSSSLFRALRSILNLIENKNYNYLSRENDAKQSQEKNKVFDSQFDID